MANFYPKIFCLLLSLSTSLLLAVSERDFAKTPEFQELWVRGGFDYYRSDANFDPDSSTTDIVLSNELVQLTDLVTWANAQYGIADRWSLGIQFSVISSSLDSLTQGDTVLAGNGLGDIITNLKWAIGFDVPIFTLELRMTLPTANSTQNDVRDIVIGDGSFDFGLYLQTGVISSGANFFLTPAVIFRSGGYSAQGQILAGIEILLSRFYLLGNTKFTYSIENTALRDSSVDVHDAIGSGNSYARLNGSPIGLELGALAGFQVSPVVALELGTQFSLMGNKYPKFFSIGGALRLQWEPKKEPKKPRAREIPLEMNYQNF